MRAMLLFILISGGIFLQGCERYQENNEVFSTPATLVKIPGSSFKYVILSQDAATRIGLELVPVTQLQVPYSAIIYGLHGETWVYILTKPLTFVRKTVKIDHIEGQIAVLSAGLPRDTQVVAVGAAELYGAEYIGNIEP